jgi:hypothetical protein
MPRLRKAKGTPLVLITSRGSFVQEPASWHADMYASRERADIEELFLVGVL